MTRNGLLLASLFGIAAIVSSRVAWLEHEKVAAGEFARKKLALVEQENERLRAVVAGFEKEKAAAQQAEARSEIETETSHLRQLNFKKPVAYDVVTREGITKVIQQKLSEQYSDAEFENTRLGYVALGLIPPDFDLKKHYVDLLGEQVAAFYDQHAHKLFMFANASLDSPQNRVILSHELTHALQDQNFGLNKLPLEIKNNDDRALAASALVEGDATLEMNQFMAEHFTLKDLREDVSSVFTQNLEQIRKSPRFMREGLLFPYTAGLRFCTELYEDHGGFPAISQVFKRPPASTAQVLHPEKYWADEQPIQVPWSDISVLGQLPLEDNVAGELGIRILLEDWTDLATAEHASSGWRGDRYLVYNSGKALVWRTVWESPDAANAFLAAARTMLAKRYHFDAIKAPSPLAIQSSGNSLRLSSPTPNEVVLITAPDETWANILAGKFAQ